MKSSSKWFGGVAALVLVLTGFGAFVGADDPKKEKPPAAVQSGDPVVQTLVDALQLAAIGREYKSPEALVAAARLLATVKVTVSKQSEAGSSYDPVAEAKKLLVEAEKLAGTNDACKKLIAAASDDLSVTPRGASHGAEMLSGTVAAYNTKDFTIRFRGWSTVSLAPGPHRNSLTLRVKDLNTGDTRTAMPSYSGAATMSFDGGSGTNYVVSVVNSDASYDWRFSLLHN